MCVHAGVCMHAYKYQAARADWMADRKQAQQRPEKNT